ncbi:type II secretion system F family protein [soil metagenome]
MSRDPGDPRPPRRPRPKPLPPTEFDDQASTFQPVEGRRDSPFGDRTTEPDRPTSFDTGTGIGKGKGKGQSKTPRPQTGGPGRFERLVFGSVSSGHLATFCRQFANYQHAGVDLIKSLSSLETQFRSTALGPVLGRLQIAIRRGESLSEAMDKEPQAFDRLMRSMMRVAEARGGVPEVLRLMSSHYESRQRLFRQARSAMIYPVIVLSLALTVMFLLTLFVLPALVDTLVDMTGGQAVGPGLPWPTRVLIGFSDFVQAMGWWLIPLSVVVGFFALIYAYRTSSGKALMDELALRLPVLGALLRKIDTTRFARTLSTLLNAGVDVETSLRLTADVLHLTPLRRALRHVGEAVRDGSEMSEALRGTRRFSVDVVEVLASGEETGQIPEVLGHLADDYEEQVAYMVKNLGHLIQPVLMIGLGGIVFFIILAFVMAYISVLTNLSRGL